MIVDCVTSPQTVVSLMCSMNMQCCQCLKCVAVVTVVSGEDAVCPAP